jgi:hypothetical protein
MKKNCKIPQDKTIMYIGILILVIVLLIGSTCWYKHYINNQSRYI